MKPIILFWVLLALLCMSARINNARVVREATSESYSVATRRAPRNGTEAAEGFLSCTCMGENITHVLSKEDVMENFHVQPVTDFCRNPSHHAVCERIYQCENCTATMKICRSSNEETGNSYCTTLIAEFPVRRTEILNHSLPGPTVGRHRSPRHIPGCDVPATLQTAQVLCTKYPSSVKCKETCIFGYTLKEGITREMRCKYSENEWKPLGFEECQQPPTCTVACEKFEDYEDYRPAADWHSLLLSLLLRRGTGS